MAPAITTLAADAPDAVCRQHRVHAHLFRPGDAHDPGPRLLLRRHGPRQEHPQHADDELHQPRDRHHPVGALRLLPRLRHRLRRPHRLDLRLRRPQRHRHHRALGRLHHPGLRLRRLPDDVRDHHARPDQRRPRRPREVHAPGRCSSPCGPRSSTSRSRTGSGAPAAGSSSSASSTSPAVRRSTSTPVPRRSA